MSPNEAHALTVSDLMGTLDNGSNIFGATATLLYMKHKIMLDCSATVSSPLSNHTRFVTSPELIVALHGKDTSSPIPLPIRCHDQETKRYDSSVIGCEQGGN